MTAKKQHCQALLYISLIASIMLSASSCGWIKSLHPTPLDALTEFPGYISKADLGSMRLLQQIEVAGGIVILYRHLDRQDRFEGVEQLFVTFVTPEGAGWQAQASGGCGIPASGGFVACYAVGGNVTPLTSAYGLSREGSRARIYWADDETHETGLADNGSFLLSRPASVQVERIEVLDENGQVLAIQELHQGTE
jgi:hypothetical protein